MLHVLFIVGLVNGGLTLVKMGLDRYAPTSKADTYVGMSIRTLATVVSFLTANTQAPALPAPRSANS